MITPKQFNNITERVVDDLKQILSSDSQVSIAAASFSIYAYEALKEELEKVDCVNFIFTIPPEFVYNLCAMLCARLF